MKLRIRTRLLLWFCGLTIVLQAGFFLLFYYRGRIIMTSLIDDMLMTRAQLLLKDFIRAQESPAGVAGYQPPLSQSLQRVQMIVIDDSGTIVRPPDPPLTPALPFLDPSHAGSSPEEWPEGTDGAVVLRWRALPADGGSDSGGVAVDEAAWFRYEVPGAGQFRFIRLHYTSRGVAYTAFIGEPFARMADAIGRLGMLLMWSFPILLIVVLLGSYLIVRRGLRPLRRAIAEAGTMHGRELGRRMAVPETKDEVAELVHTVNGLLERIEQAHVQMRQFTADAAHELRTPLAAIKNQIQTARRRPRTADEYQELLASLEEDVRYMENMLAGLLLLARLDRGKIDLRPEPVALVPLLTAIAGEPAFAALHTKIAGPETLTVTAYRSLLEQVVRNIFANAARYAGAGVTLTVAAQAEDNMVQLSFADDGPGVPAEALPHLFDRFYKVDAAHSDREGVGLGLSIVQAIAQFHGGNALARHNSPKGLVVVIVLPPA